MTLAAAAIVVGLVGGSTAAASAQSSDVTVFANPASVAVGQATPVSAEGLGGLQTATFGLDRTADGSLSADASTYGPTAEAPVDDGTALVYFRASAPGTYTVDVTDGETPLGETTITVTSTPPAAGTQLSVSPSSIRAGGSATVTASNLGGLITAEFGSDGGSQGASVTPTSATVTGGTATTTFTAATPGTYTVDVTDGETPLASVTITVTAAPRPTPTATATPTPTPTSAPVSAASTAGLWTAIVVAVVVIAALIVIVVILARRRRTRPSDTTTQDGAPPPAA